MIMYSLYNASETTRTKDGNEIFLIELKSIQNSSTQNGPLRHERFIFSIKIIYYKTRELFQVAAKKKIINSPNKSNCTIKCQKTTHSLMMHKEMNLMAITFNYLVL